MPSTKPPSGMRDYLPETVAKRRYVVGRIEDVFRRYGFQPLETPAIENLSTLLGKYGEEGDQLIFRLLHRGDKLARALANESPDAADLAELGLRYDLTVPLARVVAQYGNRLPRIFKRYQIQPVWRADRPAKGRFREFWQCDVDLTGTTSLLAEAEVMNAVSDALHELGFSNFSIALNHRGILRSLIQAAGIAPTLEGPALIALDKLDKIGADGVREELAHRGIAPAFAQQLLRMTTPAPDTDNANILASLRSCLSQAEAQPPLDDLEALLTMLSDAPAGPHVRFAPALARGLGYYTGPIFEVVSDDFSGSLGGGGRYDNLVGMFTNKQVPAVGFSLGLERILLLMEERDMFPALEPAAQVMACILPETPLRPALKLVSGLRAAGIAVDVYPEQTKLKRQLAAAAAQQMAYALIIGPDEIERHSYTLKNLADGGQQVLDNNSLIATLREERRMLPDKLPA